MAYRYLELPVIVYVTSYLMSIALFLVFVCDYGRCEMPCKINVHLYCSSAAKKITDFVLFTRFFVAICSLAVSLRIVLCSLENL